MKFFILIEPTFGGRYELYVRPGSYVLGRDEATCDIVILSPAVSPQHVRLVLSAKVCKVEDLGSSSGTFKDGQAIEGTRDFSFPLEIELGKTRLTVSVVHDLEDTVARDPNKNHLERPSSEVSVTQSQGPIAPSQTHVGHFTKGREIARGGMGAILEANDRILGRTVAMKVVLDELSSEDARMRFIREATVLGQLEHPNIIPIHELGRDSQGNHFYTMKLVKGRTLQAIINDLRKDDSVTIDQYPLDRLLTVFRKVCDAVAFAHSKGIVHRDLKPENVMVGAYGEVLVMDWGLAKILKDDSQTANEANQPAWLSDMNTTVSEHGMPSRPQEHSVSQLLGSMGDLTMIGSVMGSPRYMPPEQAAGRSTDVDERSDIYSLGGILYAILTLQPPICGKRISQVLENVRTGKIALPTEVSSASILAHSRKGTANYSPHCASGRVPTALSAVAMKALANDPEDRYPTVTDLGQDVEAYQKGFATSVEELGALGQLALFVKRNKAVSISTFVAVLLIVGLTTGFLVNLKAAHNRAENETVAATVAKDLAVQKQTETRQALARSALSLAEAAMRERNGLLMEQALQNVPEDLRGTDWTYLKSQTDDTVSGFEIDGEKVGSVVPHPQLPNVFVVAIGQREVVMVNVRTGEELLTFEPSFNSPNHTRLALAISPDGKSIAIGNRKQNSAEIVIHSSIDGSKQLGWQAPKTVHLKFSPDGSLLMQTFQKPGDKGVYAAAAWDTGSGKRLWTSAESMYGLKQPLFTSDGKHVMLCPRFGKISLLTVQDGQFERTLNSHTLASWTSGPGGKDLLVCGHDGSLSTLSLNGTREILEMTSRSEPIEHMACTGNGRRFATVAKRMDGRQTIEIRDAETGRVRRSLLGAKGNVRGICLHPLSGELVVYGSGFQVWDCQHEAWTIQGVRGGTFAAKDDVLLGQAASEPYVPGGSALVLLKLSAPSPTVLWKSPMGPMNVPSDRWKLRSGPLNSRPQVSADGKRAVAISLAGISPSFCLTLNSTEGQYASAFRLRYEAVNARLNDQGTRFVPIRRRAGVLRMYDFDGGKALFNLEMKAGDKTQDVQWIKDGQELLGLITSPTDHKQEGTEEWIYVWDANTGKKLRSMRHESRMDLLAIAPAGDRFAEAGADRNVRIRDIKTLEILHQFRVHNSRVTGLAWHPKKSVLATTSGNWRFDFGI